MSEGTAIKYDLTANSPEVEAMQIRLGYELVYECPQPTPMLLMLNAVRVQDAMCKTGGIVGVKADDIRKSPGVETDRLCLGGEVTGRPVSEVLY